MSLAGINYQLPKSGPNQIPTKYTLPTKNSQLLNFLFNYLSNSFDWNNVIIIG